MSTWAAFFLMVAATIAFAFIFHRRIINGETQKLSDFQRWTKITAVVAAVLVIISTVPIYVWPVWVEWPTQNHWKDIAASANVVGPLVLSVSVTLASIFYSAGEWYEHFQRFKFLGILEAREDREGRGESRSDHWQKTLLTTQDRVVILGTTLGGWFITDWHRTRENLLTILARARAEVLLADPTGDGFQMRTSDPGELAETAKGEREAKARAKDVYKKIEHMFNDDVFQTYIKKGQLKFYTYKMTPLSVVWVDDRIFYTSYLPCISDRECPEFIVKAGSAMGAKITTSIEALIKGATPIESAQEAAELAGKCA